MAPRTRVPLLLLTGFLGSGKTSLLARWLREPAFSGAMVIVNELGEVGLDDRLVETSADAPLLLENGCACCAAGEDLSATLERLFFDRLHRRIPAFSWVLIETTGVADPAPILQRLSQGIVGERYELRGVVTTFDARLGPAQVASHPECRLQLEHADEIILTKVDVADAAQIRTARASIAGLRADVPVLESERSNVSSGALLDALARRETPHVCSPHCDHDHDHDHGPHVHGVHTDGLTSAFAPMQASDEDALRGALSKAMMREPAALLRIKGLVQFTSGDWALVQAVPGDLDIKPAAPHPRPERSGLTIIAQQHRAGAIAQDLMGDMAQGRA